MAAYPNYMISPSSSKVPVTGVKVDIMADGSVAAVCFYTTPTYRFNIVHKDLPFADVSALSQFYENNKTLQVTLTWPSDGSTYSVLFEKPPSEAYQYPMVADVSVSLIGKRIS